MKKLLLATAASAVLMSGTAMAADVKIGVILGFTGPIESITPAMGASADLAIAEANASGKFLNGDNLVAVRADSTCIDAAAATAAAERLVTSEGVVGIMGADCSGVTGAILSNVAVANGVVMVSPSATSPALTTAEDNGLFFRTAPSDARQGEILSGMLIERGIMNAAVTYQNSDYGKGLADSFKAAYTAAGGTVTIEAAHEDGKADYTAEVGALDAAGGDILAVFGYADQGGKGIIQASSDAGAFDTYLLGDGMFADALVADMGDILEGSIGALPWAEGAGTDAFNALATAAGVNAGSSYTRESYDAAALLILAMAKGGATTREAISANLLAVANGPGEAILPGELGKGLEILAAGGDVDYVGATNVDLIGPGEAAGTYREYTITGSAFETVKIH